MLYYMLYSEGLDAIARHYIRQQADDPTAHDRWRAEFDRLCDGYSGHLQDWAAPPPSPPKMKCTPTGCPLSALLRMI